jgi:RHS repeat-associated protein
VPNLYRFGTKRVDADPALCHFVRRTYVGRLGVYQKRDDIRFMDGRSQYPYVAARPTAYVDPTGSKICAPVQGSLQALMYWAELTYMAEKDKGKERTDRRITWELLSCLACQESGYDACALSKDGHDYGLMQLRETVAKNPGATAECQRIGALPPEGQLDYGDKGEEGRKSPTHCCQWRNQPRFGYFQRDKTWYLGRITECLKGCENSIWNVENQIKCAAAYMLSLVNSVSPHVSLTMLICAFHKGQGSLGIGPPAGACSSDKAAVDNDKDGYVTSVLECLQNLGKKHDPKDPTIVRPPEGSI